MLYFRFFNLILNRNNTIMKQRLLILAIAIFTLAACSKKDEETPEEVNLTFHPTATDTLVYQGAFVDVPDLSARGIVKLYRNPDRQVLRFESFESANGPDLQVYLSKDSNSVSDFIRIGDLQAIKGSFNYTFNKTVNTTDYNYVLVYCADNDDIFGHCKLQ